MPPTLQTMSPAMQQSSPAAAGSPGMPLPATADNPLNPPMNTIFYPPGIQARYAVLADEAQGPPSSATMPFMSYQQYVPYSTAGAPMPYAMAPTDPQSEGSAGSSPAPQQTHDEGLHSSPIPAEQQHMTGMFQPITTATVGYPVQEPMYQQAVATVPGQEGGMVYGVPAIIPGQGVTPTQMLHIQIPIPAQQAHPQGPVSQPYQPTDSALTTPVPASQHSSVTTNMEVVWHSEFERLFKTFNPNHKWFLVPCMEPPKEQDYHGFKDSAKVRFCCKCGNGWTSMKGRVMFWFYLDQCAGAGFVYFRLYGQRCSKCNDPEFTHAMWYPEEVLKVVSNVYKRVGQVFYNFHQPPLSLVRRDGKPRNQHNAKLCQACAEGVCKENFIAS